MLDLASLSVSRWLLVAEKEILCLLELQLPLLAKNWECLTVIQTVLSLEPMTEPRNRPVVASRWEQVLHLSPTVRSMADP